MEESETIPESERGCGGGFLEGILHHWFTCLVGRTPNVSKVNRVAQARNENRELSSDEEYGKLGLKRGMACSD